jgi:hypothetical protein
MQTTWIVRLRRARPHRAATRAGLIEQVCGALSRTTRRNRSMAVLMKRRIIGCF